LRLLAAAAALLTAISWGRYLLLRILAPDLGRLATPLAVPAAGLLLVCAVAAFVAHREVVARAEALGLPRLLRAALVIAGIAALMLPVLSNDLFSVAGYTDLFWNSEVNPLILARPGLRASRFYDLVSPAWRWAPCVYGPLQLVFWAPALAGQALGAVAGMKAMALLAHVVLLLLMWAHVRARPAAEAAAAFALAALAPVLWVEGAGQAHADLLAAVFVALWLLLAARGHAFGAGLALGLAVASKLTALVIAGMYLVHLLGRGGSAWTRVRACAIATAGLVAGVVPFYAMVWDGPWTLQRPLLALGWRWPTHTFYELVFHVLQALGARTRDVLPQVNRVASLATLAVAVLGIVVAARSRTVERLAAVAFGVFVLSVTLAAPVYHAWYLVPCVPLALELKDEAWRRWFLANASGTLLLGGSCLFEWGGLPHDLYRIATVSLVCISSAWLLPARARELVRGT
jgi:hypothetical protein